MLKEQEKTRKEIIECFARHVSSGKADFFAAAGIDFVAGEREGIYLSDLDGRRLINCHCNGGVGDLGHRNPRLIAAMQHALERYDIGNHHLLTTLHALLAQAPGSTLASDLNRVVFGVSGGEAIDLALKLAHTHSHRPGIISDPGGLPPATPDWLWRQGMKPTASPSSHSRPASPRCLSATWKH